MRWLRRVLLLALIIAGMIGGWRFVAENQEPVSVHYVAGELGALPLWQVVLAAFAAGASLVALCLLFSSARHRLMRRRYRKAIGGLEAEIHQLRNLPLAPDADPPGGAAPAGSLPTRGASSGSG